MCGDLTGGYKSRDVLHRPANGLISAVQEIVQTLALVDDSRNEAVITQLAMKSSLDGN